MFLTFLFHSRKVCIANRNIGQKFGVFFNKYISVILAFVDDQTHRICSALTLIRPLNLPDNIRTADSLSEFRRKLLRMPLLSSRDRNCDFC